MCGKCQPPKLYYFLRPSDELRQKKKLEVIESNSRQLYGLENIEAIIEVCNHEKYILSSVVHKHAWDGKIKTSLLDNPSCVHHPHLLVGKPFR